MQVLLELLILIVLLLVEQASGQVLVVMVVQVVFSGTGDGARGNDSGRHVVVVIALPLSLQMLVVLAKAVLLEGVVLMVVADGVC